MTEPQEVTEITEITPPLEDTPEHRALLAQALEQHAEEMAETDPERAELAQAAATAAASGAQLPYVVGTWGGRPNYSCRWCPDAHLSERSAAIHGQSCKYRPKPGARSRPPVGGIT